MLVEINTAYYTNGAVIKEKRAILLNYCKSKLKHDIIVNMSLIIGELLNKPYFFILELLRLIDVTKLINKISDYFHLVERYSSITTLFKLTFLVITTAHFFSCGFELIGILLKDRGENTWLKV